MMTWEIATAFRLAQAHPAPYSALTLTLTILGHPYPSKPYVLSHTATGLTRLGSHPYPYPPPTHSHLHLHLHLRLHFT